MGGKGTLALALPASSEDTLCFRAGRERSKLANYGSSGDDSHVQAILCVLLTPTGQEGWVIPAAQRGKNVLGQRELKWKTS